MDLLKLKIVSPEKLVFEDNDIDSITLPTESGEITILPGHIPLVGILASGEIVSRKKGQATSLVTTQGFLRIEKNGQVFILSDYAIRSDDIEIAKVEEAKKKAEQIMKEKNSEKDFAIAESQLRRTLLELKIAQKGKKKIRTS